MRRFIIFFSLAAAYCFAAVNSATAQDALARARAERTLAVENALDAALDQPAEAFYDMPLADAVDYLANRYRVPISLDTKALQASGVDPYTLIAFRFAGTPLRDPLRRALEPHELAWTFDRGVVLVTDRDKANQIMITKLYPMNDLIVKPPGRMPDVDSMMDLLTTTVHPDSWDANGGPGAISWYPNMLIITNTQEVHEDLAKLLVEMRQKKSVPARRLPRRSYQTRLFHTPTPAYARNDAAVEMLSSLYGDNCQVRPRDEP